jgi:pimeloyl-ACP methyl ester carboxylesterase
MVGDTVELLELLRDRFGGPTFIAGFSLGATIGATAAARRPDLVSILVAVALEIDGPAAATNAYEFAVGTARERGDRRASRQLATIGPPPHLTSKQFSTRARWAINFGGVTGNETVRTLARQLVAGLVRSPDYSAGDVVRTLRGITATQAALLSDLAMMDLVRTLPRIDVPIVMVQGHHDQVAPGDVTERYFGSLAAPGKDLVWFEHSAHTPHLEEPERFREILMQLREGGVATYRTRATAEEHGWRP